MRKFVTISFLLTSILTLTLGVDNLKEIISKLNADYIVGKPIEAGELILIPVSSINLTFINGDVFSTDIAGGNVNIKPVGFIAVKGEKAWFIPLKGEEKVKSAVDDFLKIYDKLSPLIMEILKYSLQEKSKSSESLKPPAPPVKPLKPSFEVSNLLVKAKKSFDSKDYKRAYEELEEFLKQYPQSLEAHVLMGRTCAELLKEVRNPTDKIKYGIRAFKEFEKAVQIDPNNVSALIGYGYSLLYSPPPFGSVDKAIQNFKKALEKDEKNVEAMLGMAMAYKKKGEFEKAKQYLNMILKIDPSNSQAKKMLESIDKTK